MATINPFQGPANYAVDVQSPFESALGGFKIGAGIAEVQAARQKRELEIAALAQAQQRQTELQNLYSNPNATRLDFDKVAAFLPKDQADRVIKGFEAQTAEQQQDTLSTGAKAYAAITSGNLDAARSLLLQKAEGLRNSGREKEAATFDDYSNMIALNPTGARANIGILMATLPGGKEFLDNADKALSTIRAEAEAPSKLSEQKAKAALAVQVAENAVATAPDDVAKAKAQREFEQAKAAKEAVDAKYAERIAVDAIIKRAADLNLTKSQTDKVLVETRNLTETGKMLKLDYDAAVKGVPLPSKNTGANVGNATEDERKAAGWLSQADNAYKNMLSAMYTKEGKRTGAEEPGVGEAIFGNIARGADRQNFVQAASSLSEALLRAATGAGVNADEAKQKLEELTPLLTDGAAVVGQKLAAIPVYLDSLKARAGRAAPTDYRIPTKESVTAAKEITITVGGKTFSFPTQDAADAFKKAAGIN
jgi:hypothetical protein